MSGLERLTDKVSGIQIKRITPSEIVPLNKATYVELFFDLVFIFCMRSILPVITDVEGGDVGWYSYYTFWFTFALMLQIWFNSTIFMNRFGTGGVKDIVFLFTNMFLLIVMTQAISIGWENYAIYNVCWVIITINTMIHWMVRYHRIIDPPKQLTRDTRLAMAVLGTQATLVLVSHLMPKNPAQVVCLTGMLLGYVFWYAGSKERLGEENREHLAERCALLMILTFGETIVGLGNEVPADLRLFSPVMYFLLVIGMFLVYLNEIVNLLDLSTIRGGRRYMALSAWMTFCVANVTAGFEMSMKSMTLMGINADIYFGISVAVFLLCFFLFIPFNKYQRPSAKWTAARIVACLLVLAHSSTLAVVAQRVLVGAAGETGLELDLFLTHLGHGMMVLAVFAVYAVLVIDRIGIRRAKRRSEQIEQAARAELAKSAEQAAQVEQVEQLSQEE